MIFNPDQCEQVHNRKISVSCYIYEADAIGIEGRLTDDRKVQSHSLYGEARPPGIVHDLVIRMIIRGPKLTIEDVEVEMLTIPNPDCREIQNSLQPLIGQTISSGFTTKVHRLVGGVKGCAHLVALTRAMASAAIQGAWSAVSTAPLSKGQLSKRHLKAVVDTCHLWRADGPLMKKAQKLLDGE